MSSPLVDDRVLAAATRVIAEHGWADFTLERVAASAGVSRVTLYRRGVTKDVLLDALAVGAAQAWQAGIWPALMGPGDAAERLGHVLEAGCEVVEAHLPLLAGLDSAPDPVFHLDAPGGRGNGGDGVHDTRDVYVAPLVRLLRDGATDASLAAQPDPIATATVVFNVLTRTYLHLRHGHGWTAAAARTALTDLLLGGLLPRPPSPSSARESEEP